ncbi:hypothetical protein P4C99_14440 [Pontiellaceae bacterium B1224]|nr:hypothetical protein [Pontiellaceae bacterium B1224]
MKKTILCIIFLVSALHAGAADLQTSSGVVFKNVTIISADPDRMLIVHDGGGCQVEFKDLKPDSLTVEQRSKVEEELRYYTQRSKRLEKIRLETEEFEAEQLQKGLVEFEGGWVTPLERENILIAREERKVELERKRIQLAKEKAELEKLKLQERETRSATVMTYGYYTPVRTDCFYTLPRGHRKPGSKPGNNHGNNSEGRKNNVIRSGNNSCIVVDGVAFYNRGPFNR